jgi:NAD(P)-dependent dehydrogenase (short-subunit alcohol dehydrogenase family)
MKRFEDRVVLLTGASNGIGKAVAQRLASEGAQLLCLDINQEQLEESTSEIDPSRKQVIPRKCNVSNVDEVKDAVADCIQQFGKMDVLINVAGVIKLDFITRIDDETWQRIMDVNLSGTFYLCRECLPHLEESKGNIVNISSTSALRGLPYGAAYGASKGGVSALTKAIAVEYAKKGVRANTVCPGSIMTNMQKDSGLPDDIDWDLIPRIASLKEFGQPEDIAAMVALVASDQDGKHITGSELVVDGGTIV